MADLLGMMMGGGGGGLFGQIEGAFTDKFVNSGVSTVNFMKNLGKKESDVKNRQNAPRTAMRELAREISQFVPEKMKEEFVEWIQIGETLERYATKPQCLFPSEEQVLAEELYMNWIGMEVQIRNQVQNPEQRVSFEEISMQMKDHMEKLICFIMEACTTKYIGDEAIVNIMNQMEERENT